MEKCRVCLTTDGVIMLIDDEFVYNFNSLTNLDITSSDELNQFVCETCLHSVNFFIAFRKKCLLSDSILKNECEIKLQENSNAIEDVENIKTECEMEYDDSFMDTVDYAEDISLSYNIKNEDGNDIRAVIKPKKKCGRKKKSIIKSIFDPSSYLIPCGLCHQDFENTNALSDHFESHKKTMRCVICSAKFTSWLEMLVHRSQHLPAKRYHCYICQRRFTSVVYMEYHYRKEHFGEKDYLIPCGLCDHKFETPRKLKKHMWAVHADRAYICDYCGKRCKTKQAITLHIYHHLGLKSFRCDKCDFSCNFLQGLKDHKIRRHVPKKVYCDNCKRPFKTPEDRDNHKCSIKPDIVCPVCGLQLTANMRLTRHMETHKVAKYKCQMCPRIFKTGLALKAHTDRHDGTPSNHCSYCPAKFYTGSALIKHRRTHTGEKPYVCTICSKAFTANYNLKVHMKVHGLNLVHSKDEN